MHQATFEVSNVHTPTYIYIEKTKNVHFFGYLYKKKPFRAFRGPYTSIHQGSYTKVHTPSYILSFKCPHTDLYLYRKKLKMSTFLVTYIRKNPFELSNTSTPIHPYTKVHTPSYFLGFKCPQTYIYIEKTPNVDFFGYLYKKEKPFRAFKHPYTHTTVHQIL